VVTAVFPNRFGTSNSRESVNSQPDEGLRIAVNGRFRSQQVTGVQRYASEVYSRLPQLREILPGGRSRGLGGHFWEQLALPSRLKGALLWSPCNTGPLSVRKQVVTIHDCAFHDHPEAFSPAFVAWYRWLVSRLAANVRRIITVSDFSRRRLIEYLQVDPQKIVAIPNGVGGRFQPSGEDEIQSVRKQLGLPRRYVLCIGSLEPRKNLLRLLEAWRQLRAGKADCALVLCGVRSHVFRDFGLSQLPDDVILTGYVAEEHLPGLYGGAELFVYPSIYEGFGLTVLEAMACGVAVVCSNTTSLPEVAGDAALLVNPYEIDDIASGIRRLLADESLRGELRRRGLERATKFNWNHTAELTWNILMAATGDN
jgi:glycosyltransferase involved in cell wall biosynthesis